MATFRQSLTPEELLASYAPGIQQTAAHLRRLVREVVPDVTEAAHPGWRLIGYRRSGYFCCIVPQRDHVRLGFEYGVALPDPDGLLEGTGKQTRYVRVQSGRGIPSEKLKALIRAAVFHDEERHKRRVPR